MPPKYTLVCLLILKYCSLFAQLPDFSDSLSLSWERMAGPPAWINQYAEGNGKVFAAAEEALFVSDDNGQSWEMVQSLGRKRIRQLLVKDTLVMLIAEEPLLLNPGNPFTSIELHQVWRSADGGLSWKKVDALIQEPETPYNNITYEIYSPGSSIVVFNYLHTNSASWAADGRLMGSDDEGVTWKQIYSNAYLFHASQDTFCFVNGELSKGFFCKATTGAFNLTEVNLSGASPSGINLIKVFYHKGVFYLIKNDNSFWETSDLGQNWSSTLLPINGTIQEVYVKDTQFFLRTTNGLFFGALENPSDLQEIYHGEQGKTLNVNSFFPGQNGFWLNSDLFQTLFSNNNGQDWSIRSNGLSSEVGSLNGLCENIWARSLGKGNTEGGWYHSDFSGQEWIQTQDPYFYQYSNAGRFLGSFSGFSFRYLPPHVQRSEDCGQNWSNSSVLVTAQPKGLIQHLNKLVLYSSLDDKLWHSQNNGNNWTLSKLPDYGVDEIISLDGHLVANYTDRIFVSSDLGNTWEERIIPFEINKLYSKTNRLVIFQIPVQQGTIKVAESTDLGLSWTIIAEIPILDWQKTIIPYLTPELIILHKDHQIYASGDDGLHWIRLIDLPFNSRITIYNFTSANPDTLIPQATAYLAQEGSFYAATEAHGLWRCSADSILAHLQGTTQAVAPVLRPHQWKLSPNPTSGPVTVHWEGSIAETIDVYLSSLDGRQTWLGQRKVDPGTNLLRFDLNGYPEGMFFLSIQSDSGISTQKIWHFK